MTDPRLINILEYDYNLPPERIARYPLEERDSSQLLIYREGNIQKDIFRNLSRYLPENALLIFNNTKVIPARIYFRKPTGATVEIFCLEPDTCYADYSEALLQKGRVLWQCMIGKASKWKHGQVLTKKIETASFPIQLSASFVQKKEDSFTIEFRWKPDDLCFAEILQYAGSTPLPPYLRRKEEDADKDRYQTLYARYEGSVAAPTAGLHFTKRVFDDLKQKQIECQFLTLHVGAGTFKPVKAKYLIDHQMHAEWFEVKKEVIEALYHASREQPVVSVGTTSLRTLESLYWLGIVCRRKKIRDTFLSLSQWEAYDLQNEHCSLKASWEALLEYMSYNGLEAIRAKTELLIAPGYTIRVAHGLITNFHQPQSTLLLLIAAFIGKDWKKVYEYALTNQFRFLSYGDSSLLWR
ncbi:MAG: S-adenosylmethionine:tRNA ribosyltransferase-isomerase [Chitinophagaceae bacterium]|nr:S-adenosylmethionine:tRNA ribosyltransferase-isomerase [Chitinophagaceae bacterium]